MALTEMEFLGNDRYIKYRYAQETPINVTTMAASWEMPTMVKRYKIMEEFFKRLMNMKSIYEEHKIEYDDVNKIYSEPDFFKKVHTIAIPKTRSFFYGQQEYYSPSPLFQMSRTIIVTAAPKRLVSTSLSFLNMETNVVNLVVLTILLLSLLLVIHSIIMKKYKTLSTKEVVKKFAGETMENMWNNASLLCAEPIPAILPHITCRLLASSWLIGVTFILFFLGCYLCTEFTIENYNCIDTLSDLIKSGIPPIMIEGTGTYTYLEVLAAQDPVVQKWLDALDKESIFSSLPEYLMLDGYLPVLSGEKALIISDVLLAVFMGEFLSADFENKEFITSSGGFYFSQHEVDLDYLHFIYNASWIRGCTQLLENTKLSMEPAFEMQVTKFLDSKFNHFAEQITWKIPLKSTVDLDLSSVIIPFYSLLILLSGTVAVVMAEIFFN